MYREAGFVLFCITYVKSKDRDFRGGRMICLKKPVWFLSIAASKISANLIWYYPFYLYGFWHWNL